MPSYVFEVATEQGVQRHAFTLDDDRPLGPQITQVLEELRQRGVLLKGGRDDELAAYWSGHELDRTKRPAEQGMSPARPVELRMRERVVARTMPVDRSLPKGVLASAAWGYAGAFIAWAISGRWTDTGGILATYARLDQATMLLLGGLVGAAVLAGGALRRRGSVPLGALAGFGIGAAGAVIAASAALLLPGVVSLRGFIVARVLGWAVAGGLTALLLSLYGATPDGRRSSESLALGLLSGAVAGVVFALPGPSDLWQALACIAFGVGVALAAEGPGLWHAAAIVEAVGTGRAAGILSLREWPVPARGVVAIGGARLAWQAGRLALHPAASGATVDGRRVSEAMYLSPGPLALDGAAYRVRVLEGA
jgi:hypothetical protein